MPSDVQTYLFEVINFWLVAAVALYGIVEIIAVALGKKLKYIPWRLRITFIVGLLFYAQFLGWRTERQRWNEEHESRTTAEADLQRIQGELSGKDQMILTLNGQLASRTPQIQMPTIQIPPPTVIIGNSTQRSINAGKRREIIADLRELGMRKLAVRHSIGCAECRNYANDFSGMFAEAGWVILEPHRAFAVAETYGLRIRIPPPSDPPTASEKSLIETAVELVRILKDAGIDVDRVLESGMRNVDHIELMIGLP